MSTNAPSIQSSPPIIPVRTARFGLIPAGFLIAVLVWLAAFICRLPQVFVAPGFMLTVLLGIMFISAVLYAKTAKGINTRYGVIAKTAGVLLLAGVVNVLLVGSAVGNTSAAASAAEGTYGNDAANQITMSALLWIPGSLFVSLLVGVIGGVVGSQFNKHLKQPSQEMSHLNDPWVRIQWTTAEQAALGLVTIITTFCLILVGGVVTSAEAGLAVPDWPNSYQWNMFLFPYSKMVGGIYYEHAHRLIGSLVGLETMVLCIWLWVRTPAQVVSAENDDQQSPVRSKRLAVLGSVAFVLVCIQGILGGTRVISIDAWGQDGALKLAVVHATTAQIFLLTVTALVWWLRRRASDIGQLHHRSLVIIDPYRFSPLVKGLAILLILLTIGQTLVGAMHRQLGSEGAFAIHVVGAIIIMVVTMAVLGIVITRPIGNSKTAMKPVKKVFVMMITLSIQLAWGFGTWWVTTRNDQIDQVTNDFIILFTAGHVLIGAKIVMQAMYMALEIGSFQIERPKAEA